MTPIRIGSLALLLLLPSSARAQEADGCTKFKWSVARERSAFAAPDLAALASGGSLPGAAIAVNATLQPQADVAFAKPPGRAPRVNPAFGAVFTLPSIAAAGTYQVTLSEDAWIDVLQNGKEVRSAGFSGQTGCAGVRKSVRFPLQPGPATLQISGAPSDSIKVDILPAE